jgi:Tfp pilus assembly protein PilP
MYRCTGCSKKFHNALSSCPECGGPLFVVANLDDEGDDETESETESTGQSGPLRRYSYEKYRLSGLISETAVPKAMFIAPDQVGHLVKKGDRLGKEGGVVQDIRDNAVELELPPQGEEGRSRTVTMELREAELPEEQQQEGLSEQEQKALQDLLESEEGRKEIRERFQQDSSSNTSGGGGGGESSGFQGLEPPE